MSIQKPIFLSVAVVICILQLQGNTFPKMNVQFSSLRWGLYGTAEDGIYDRHVLCGLKTIDCIKVVFRNALFFQIIRFLGFSLHEMSLRGCVKCQKPQNMNRGDGAFVLLNRKCASGNYEVIARDDVIGAFLVHYNC